MHLQSKMPLISTVQKPRLMQRNRFASITALTLTVLTMLSFTVSAAPAKPKSKGGPAAPVVVVNASLHKLAPSTLVAGTVISRNDAKLATEVTGQLKKVAEVGARVKENEVVARIDDTFVKLRIQELKSAVQREQAQLQFLREEVKRLKRLQKQNNAAKTRLEQTQADREIAKNNLEIARTRLKLAREQLWRHEIRAPFAGVIAERYRRPGERADEGDQVVRLIDPNALEVQARVPLSSINYVREGTELNLSAEQAIQQALTGIVRTIVPVGDERSRLMDLRIGLLQTSWRVGQPVRVALPTASPREVLAVPRDALVLRRDGASVFRINGENTAEKISVEIGIASGDYMEVIGPLSAGDRVVVRGSERLRPGQSVKIIDPPS